MIGVAAGMSAAGMVPFAHSFGPFASRRCVDQIFISCAYAKLNVRIIGSDPGVTAAYNGGTHMPFEDVDYWQELCQIMEWSKTHVHSTFHICWGAQAGLYYHYGVPKQELPEKLFGVYPHQADYKRAILLRGFDDTFWAPHSRHTTVNREDIEAVPELKILASSAEAGVYAMMTKEGRQIFITGHSEYDPDTLKNEYLRDKAQGLPISVPANYFPEDDDTREPIVRWRGHANLLFSNWLNYFVYQTTPYDLMTIGEE